MKELLNTPTAFSVLYKRVWHYYPLIFKGTLSLIALLALFNFLFSIIVPKNVWIASAFLILSILVVSFLQAWILHYSDVILTDQRLSIMDSFQVAKHRYLKVLGAVVAYAILAIVLSLIVVGLIMLGDTVGLGVVGGFIGSLIAIFVMFLVYFVFPLIVIDNFTVLAAFERSVRLVWGHWWRTFGTVFLVILPFALIYFIIGIMLFHFMGETPNPFVVGIYNFIFQIIMYPLFVSVMLNLFYDLKARYHSVGFQHLEQTESASQRQSKL